MPNKMLRGTDVDDASKLVACGVSAFAMLLTLVAIFFVADKHRDKTSRLRQQPLLSSPNWAHLRGMSLQDAKDNIQRRLGRNVVWDDVTNASKLPPQIDRTSSLKVLRFRNSEMRTNAMSILVLVGEGNLVSDVFVMSKGRLADMDRD